MASKKTIVQQHESVPDSAGDRRTGSVGEKPELGASRSGGDRRSGTPGGKNYSIQDELDGATANDPGLGGA